ncbi:MAG: T9SS type A sorting domain-containing protein, partial [Paludibacter sp.]
VSLKTDLFARNSNGIVSKTEGVLDIISLNGQVLNIRKVEVGTTIPLQSGIYILRIKNSTGVSVQKFIMQ